MCDQCDNGWIPLTREDQEDAELVSRELAQDAGDLTLEGHIYRLMVFPTQEIACSECNPVGMGVQG